MKTLVAIFKAANIAEIILVTFLVTAGFYFSYPKIAAATIGLFTLMVMVSLMFSSIANCFNNLSLISFYSGKKEVNNIKTVYFWIISILFILSISLRWFSIYTVLKYALRLQVIKKLDPKVITMILGNMLFILNSLFIFCFQNVLFFRIRKKQKEYDLHAITEIGQDI
jgi:hypothetical protein